ncbi:hypothetical protein J6590_092550, partial [Homalodisca vitripennis]
METGTDLDVLNVDFATIKLVGKIDRWSDPGKFYAMNYRVALYLGAPSLLNNASSRGFIGMLPLYISLTVHKRTLPPLLLFSYYKQREIAFSLKGALREETGFWMGKIHEEGFNISHVFSEEGKASSIPASPVTS